MFLHSSGAPIVIVLVGILTACRPDSPLENRNDPIDRPLVEGIVPAADTLTPSADNLLRSSPPNENQGLTDSLRVKVELGQSDTNRSVIRFDQAAIAARVGGGILASATLELTIKGASTTANGHDVALHRLQKPWTETGSTWKCGDDTKTNNKKPDCPSTLWVMSGTPDAYVPTATSVVHLVPGQSGIVRFTVTSDVRAFLGGQTNHGWLLKIADEAVASRVSFWSRQATAQPKLILSVTSNEVPPEAPDTLPDWVYAPTNYDSNTASIGGVFVKNIVVAQFKAGTSQAERQAAIDSTGGVVVGGVRSGSGEGLYYLSLEDSTRGGVLVAASQVLERQPQIAFATYDFQVVPAYRKPADGGGWQSWHLSRDSLGSPAQPNSNWALEAIMAPMAWGCATGDPAIQIGVVDGFGSKTLPADLAHLQVHDFSLLSLPPYDSIHGLYVASVLAARGNNGSAMTGVMWNANIHGYEVGPGSIARLVARIKDAARGGSRVINVSSSVPRQVAESIKVRAANTLSRTLSELRSENLTPLVVIAAGNWAADASTSGFPRVRAGQDSLQVLIVTASTVDSALWTNPPEGSNFGPLVDVAAPGSAVGVLDWNNQVRQTSGTSFAAPVVSGIAGLLMSFDDRLNAMDVRRLIRAGADSGGWKVSHAGGVIPVVNAYWSLKLAAQRPGAPLCGNRVWAEGTGVRVQRGTTTEEIFDAGAATAFLNAHHGGHRLDLFINGLGDRTLRFENGRWTGPLDFTQPSAGESSGSYNSYRGATHDGDSLLNAIRTFVATGVQYDIRLGTQSSSGRLLGTTTIPLAPKSGYFCVRQSARYDTAGTFIEYSGCSDSSAATFEEARTVVADSPTGDLAFLSATTLLWTTTSISDWVPCPGVPIVDGHAIAQCKFATGQRDATSSTLYSVPHATGSVQTVHSRPGAVYWVGLSEDAREIVIASGNEVFTGGSGLQITNCTVEYRSFPALALRQTIANPIACMGGRGAATIAPVRAGPSWSQTMQRPNE
jgi:hypothetical protein